MSYVTLPKDELSTTWDDDPAVRVFTRRGGNPVDLLIEFFSAPEKARRTRLTFRGVFEYRWVDFDYSYLQPHPEDFEFSLIEIIDSEDIRKMIEGGMYSNSPIGERLGGVLRETDVHHYRISFDDHGCYDVICTEIKIEITDE